MIPGPPGLPGPSEQPELYIGTAVINNILNLRLSGGPPARVVVGQFDPGSVGVSYRDPDA